MNFYYNQKKGDIRIFLNAFFKRLYFVLIDRFILILHF